jgi:hypothetical protein
VSEEEVQSVQHQSKFLTSLGNRILMLIFHLYIDLRSILFLSDCLTKTLYLFPIIPIRATCPPHVILFYVTPAFGEAYNDHLCVIIFCGNRISLQNIFILEIQNLFQLFVIQSNNTALRIA